MSTGTNIERITENNGIINDNNADLVALKNRIDNLPDTSTATAQAKDIMAGKTAYVNGLKVTGTNDNPDWSEIGYSSTPQEILDGFDYAKEIYDNWDSSVTQVNGMFVSDTQLKYLPLVDFHNITSMWNFCINASYLEYLPLIDTSNVTNMQRAFSGTKIKYFPLLNTSKVTIMADLCSTNSTLIYMPLIDTSKNTNSQSMFYGCTSIVSIPAFNFENVTNVNSCFQRCYALQNLPVFNFSKVTTMNNFCEGNSNLTNDSLNNIMASLLTATSYTGTKTLKQIGLSSAQATTCQTLSNWTALSQAGWTTRLLKITELNMHEKYIEEDM